MVLGTNFSSILYETFLIEGTSKVNCIILLTILKQQTVYYISWSPELLLSDMMNETSAALKKIV